MCIAKCWSVVIQKSDPAETRVALVCADAELCGQAVVHLRGVGGSVRTYSDLAEFSAARDQTDAVLIFADALPPHSLRDGLNALERMRSGPMLIVVSDQSPPPWTPKSEGNRVAMVVTHRAWPGRALDLLQLRNPAATPATDYSGPELPFTD
jgi:hypothetical protein